MISLLPSILLGVLIFWFVWRAPRGKRTGCTCNRERPPWLYRRHEREGLMWLIFLWFASSAVGASLLGETVASVFIGLVSLVKLREILEHRKGKRSVLGRLSGRVRVTRHGTLRVDHG